MSTLLHISVSPMGDHSISRGVAGEFVTAWTAAHADGVVIERDLAANPVPHLDAEVIMAGYVPAEDRPASQAAKHDARIALINEILGVDEIVISTPMWNWNLPSVLKAYFDNIIIPGVLDGSGADGLRDKKITNIVAQGGSYAEGAPRYGWDHQTEYIRLVAAALGATDIEVITSEFGLAGVAPGMENFLEHKNASIIAATEAAKARAAA